MKEMTTTQTRKISATSSLIFKVYDVGCFLQIVNYNASCHSNRETTSDQSYCVSC